jgi:hypothetical protein
MDRGAVLTERFAPIKKVSQETTDRIAFGVALSLPSIAGMKVLLSSCLVILAIACAAGAEKRPNFIFILGEGHGWSSTSVQMDDAVPESKSAYVRTPNLEKLAAGGMRFAHFYAPSRASLLTGKSPAQLHMTFVGEGKQDSGGNLNGRLIPPSASTELPAREVTIAERLKRAGYATAHFGKWHIGPPTHANTALTKTTARTTTAGPTVSPILIPSSFTA